MVRKTHLPIGNRTGMSVFSPARQYRDLQELWVDQRERVRNSYQEIQELARQIERLQREIETARKRVKLVLSNIKITWVTLRWGVSAVRGDLSSGDKPRDAVCSSK